MRKAAIRSVVIAAAAVFFANVQSASAGVDSIRAEAYFNAISGGNADTITSFHADNAEFHWVGGPLAGVYKGKEEIRQVWEKFTKQAGDITHKVLELSESQNDKVSTVTARVNLIGPKEVPVKFIMMLQEGKIVSSIWQVDKPVTVFAAEIGKPEQYLDNKPEAADAPQTPPQDQPAAEAPDEEQPPVEEAAPAPDTAPAEPQERVAAADPENGAAEPAQTETPQEAAQDETPVDAAPAEQADLANSDYKPEADRKPDADRAEPQTSTADSRLAAIPTLPERKAEDGYVAKPKKVERKVARQRDRARARRNYEANHRNWRRRAYGDDYDDIYGSYDYDDYDDYDYRYYRRYRGYGRY